MKKSIAIIGINGRMGSLLKQEIINDNHFAVGASFDPRLDDIKKLEQVFNQNDYIVDFSHNELTLTLLKIAQNYTKPIIICTTGFNKEECELYLKASASKFPVVLAPNTSMGAHIQLMLSEILAKLCDDEFDIDIFEKHHRNKADFPSGTAKAIASSILQNKPGYNLNSNAPNKREAGIINIAGQRSGNIFGEHEVSFTSNYESISIKHTAFNRNIFAKGALRIVKWLDKNQPKSDIYFMKDIIK
jgi:4-hydroxy-tetrahydrodipicolinate reductase